MPAVLATGALRMLSPGEISIEIALAFVGPNGPSEMCASCPLSLSLFLSLSLSCRVSRVPVMYIHLAPTAHTYSLKKRTTRSERPQQPQQHLYVRRPAPILR